MSLKELDSATFSLCLRQESVPRKSEKKPLLKHCQTRRNLRPFILGTRELDMAVTEKIKKTYYLKAVTHTSE